MVSTRIRSAWSRHLRNGDRQRRTHRYVEHDELQPIDPQTNGPQLFYGLRYHTHIVKPGEVETFHDQVGYWLWEPAACTVILMLAIPRAQLALAAGSAEPDAKDFEVSADLGAESYGILSNPFLLRAFNTASFRMRVTVHDDTTWSYEQHTIMRVPGRDGLVDHGDRTRSGGLLKRHQIPSRKPRRPASKTLERPRRVTRWDMCR